jgi:hypothetical protein
MSLSSIYARTPRLLVAAAIGLLIAVTALRVAQPLAGQDAHALLQRALAAVRSAEGFTVDMRYTQRQPGLVAARDDVLELAIRGQVQGADKARFTFSAPSAQSGRGDTAHEYLLADGLVYQRAGEQWQRVDELPASAQVAEGGLSLAAAASNVTALPAQETERGALPAHRLRPGRRGCAALSAGPGRQPDPGVADPGPAACAPHRGNGRTLGRSRGSGRPSDPRPGCAASRGAGVHPGADRGHLQWLWRALLARDL